MPLRVERDIFVQHGSGRNSFIEPVYTGGTTVGYQKGSTAVLAGDAGQGLISGVAGIQQMKPEFAPHLAPVQTNTLNNAVLGSQAKPNVLGVASKDPARALRFAHGRRDGQYSYTNNLGEYTQNWSTSNKIPVRGSSDPLETGDFDNGVGLCPDGPYINSGDDGDARDVQRPYFAGLLATAKANPASFTPNRVMRSAVEFGSLPTGIQARVPWQTLRFRPDPGMYDPKTQVKSLNSTSPSRTTAAPKTTFCSTCGGCPSSSRGPSVKALPPRASST
jgi:hypothetical protein